jgi:hexosaminidase
VQRWTPGSGFYTFGPGSAVVADGAGLAGTAEAFAADVGSLTGAAVRWRVGGATQPGDIELATGAAEGGPEGYRLTVGLTIAVLGNTDDGVFNGTRTILQWLRQSRTIPAGTVDDWPEYPERGLLVDVGRQFLSLDWLRARIREMSYLKLNYLYLHLSDKYGFRLESETHPEIVSAQHYTKRQISDLVAYGLRYHVQIVPEIDFPGHLDAILAAHPELRLVSSAGAVSDSDIDIADPAALALVRDLLTEYLPLFPGRYWTLGGDEYVTNYADYPQLGGKDGFYRFLNWANTIVRSAGKTMRIYNDGLTTGGSTVTIDPDIVVAYWSAAGPFGFPWAGNAISPKELAEAGHSVQNMAFTPTYYTTGGPAALFNTPPGLTYRWNPNTFVDGSTLPNNLGSLVSVWCDNPNAQTEDQIAAALFPRLRVLSQLTWGSPKPLLYLNFLSAMNSTGQAPA